MLRLEFQGQCQKEKNNQKFFNQAAKNVENESFRSFNLPNIFSKIKIYKFPKKKFNTFNNNFHIFCRVHNWFALILYRKNMTNRSFRWL